MDTSLGKQLFFLQRAVRSNLEVSINTTKLGVILPGHLYSEPNIKLDIGLWLNNPVRDLDVNEDGIRVTLSFNGQAFRCSLPWPSVWLIVIKGTGDGCVWQYDAPVFPTTDEPELGSTGSDDPAPRHRDAYIQQLKPATKPKVKLPPGWGGIVKDPT